MKEPNSLVGVDIDQNYTVDLFSYGSAKVISRVEQKLFC